MTQKSELTLRRAESKDARQIAELERLSFSAPWSETAVRDTLSRDDAVFFVAESGEACAGYVGACVVLDEGYITNIAVRPSARRKGIGRLLLDELTDECRRRGLRFLTLEVRESNSAARALYEGFGFEQVGYRKNFYRAPNEAAVLMTLYFGKENIQ